MAKLSPDRRKKLREIIKRSKSLDSAAKSAEKIKVSRADVRRYFRRIKGVKSVRSLKKSRTTKRKVAKRRSRRR